MKGYTLNNLNEQMREFLRLIQMSKFERLKELETKGYIIRTEITGFGQELLFLSEWFGTFRAADKVEIAYKYGLIDLDPTDKFISKNKFERQYTPEFYRLLEAVYWRDMSNCAYCFQRVPKGQGNIDHFIPRSAWPKEWLWLADDASNLVVSCSKCNNKKSNKYKSITHKLYPVFFQCRKDNSDDYECCISMRQNAGIKFCNECTRIRVLCRFHEEIWMPICWLESLRKWFGHA